MSDNTPRVNTPLEGRLRRREFLCQAANRAATRRIRNGRRGGGGVEALGDKYTSCCVTCGPCRLGGCSTTGELGPSHPTVGQPLNRHGSHVTQHDVHVTARWRLRTERSDIPAVPSTITKWSRRSCASAVRVFGHHKASFAPVGCGKHAHSPG